ncbi:hypothetical protein DUNSADRAFT_18731 [Dunaliella salina]|uniref:SET domain-containing protein n=1 Tax=Dunaliella salina TaxID=3046 RepID=A0ABQ7GYP4_DUNSA|nr:hypothetical protein DUNSADRAFT_18731 [Dunaliella salina]|eukprot:KAF5839731.1 hypothetical protein DUNSADRAFT_18731 [Dunaliella salina]
MKGVATGSAAAVALPAVAGALWLQTQDQTKCYGLPQALCEHPGTGHMNPEARLKQWLESRGCQLNNVEVKPSTVGEESGYGLFVAQDAPSMCSARRRRWWWPIGAPPAFTTVATFPLSSCLTAENILADPQAGTERAPCWDDMLWAHCMFWSRGHSLPVPKKEGAASNLVAQDPKGAPSFMHVHEGLVPGLDFANHSSLPQCWWEVASHPPTRPPTPANTPSSSNTSDNEDNGSSVSGGGRRERASVNGQAAKTGSEMQGAGEGCGLASSILLQLHRGATVEPGQELCINYGDTKSNEELLLLYGFVYDPDLAGQLPQSCATLDLDALSRRLEQKSKKHTLTQQEAESMHRLLGLRMAAISTFLGLLELRMSELEAPPSAAGSSSGSLSSTPGGTGSLEEDLELLAQHHRAVQASTESATSPTHQQQQQQQQQQQHELQQGVQSGGTLAHRKHCAVVYRAGQKQIIRAYAVGAREELSRIMRLLRAVEEQNPKAA